MNNPRVIHCYMCDKPQNAGEAIFYAIRRDVLVWEVSLCPGCYAMLDMSLRFLEDKFDIDIRKRFWFSIREGG